MKKIYPLLGIIGAAVYAFAVIVGGLIRSDYSPIADTISALTSAGAPNKLLLDVLFGLYNIAIIGFGIGAFLDSGVNNTRKYKAATLIIAVIGVLGLLMLVYTQDVPVTDVTTNGTIHVILAGVSAPLTMLAILLVGVTYWGNKQTRPFALYSLLSLIVILVSGTASAISVGSNNGYGGLCERIVIGTFILWIAIFSCVVLRKTINNR